MNPETAWTRLREELLASFRARTGDPELAEDLTQETFVRVHAHLGELASEDRLGPWVRRIARNVLVDHWRRHRPTEPVEPEELGEEEQSPGNLNAEVGGWLPAMIAELPPDDRVALQLAEVEGRPQREVAERLSLGLSGAKSRVQRGRARLRRALLECCHLEFDRLGNVVDYEPRDCCGGR